MAQQLTKSKEQTKDWRNNQQWYKNGKSNECEKYQMQLIANIFNIENIAKTNLRFNISNNTLENVNRPLLLSNGLDYTEDLDGVIYKDNKTYYLNFKMICDAGGAQNRSVRELNHFIKCQFDYLINYPNDNIYFINIIEGDTGYKYTYGNKKNNVASILNLYDNSKYEDIKHNIYIGDIYHFNNWYQNVSERI